MSKLFLHKFVESAFCNLNIKIGYYFPILSLSFCKLCV